MVKENILVLCAHSDDQILGVGGALAKYAKEGKNVYIVVFSFGEKSHFWLKQKVAIKMRVKESQEAGKVIGAKESIFMDLKEGKFKEEFGSKHVIRRLKDLFKKYKPNKVFTHAPDDPHPDHKALCNFVIDFCDKNKFKGDVYVYDVWTPINIKKRNLPKIVVDISTTFKTKINALKCFKSQKLSIYTLLWSVYLKSIRYGRNNGCKYAEVFFKIK